MATAKRKTTKKAAVKKTAAKKAPAKRATKKATATRKKPVVKRTTTARKTAAPKAAAKPAAKTVALGATVPTAEEAFAFGNDMMKQFFDGAATPAMPDATEFTKQGAEQFAKASSVASKSFNDAMELSKENAEAIVESGNIAAGASKTVGAELFNYANKAFSQNVEISKELFACRTLNDMFDLQSKIMKENLDGFFSESAKISELVFEAANNAAEPLQERIQETADRVNKTFNEAA